MSAVLVVRQGAPNKVSSDVTDVGTLSKGPGMCQCVENPKAAQSIPSAPVNPFVVRANSGSRAN